MPVEKPNVWVVGRDFRRADNKAHAHGVRVDGTYYENGIPNPGKRYLKIGGAVAILFKEPNGKKTT